MTAKYIVCDSGCIVFPSSFNHADFAKFKPTSAGSVTFYAEEGDNVVAHCYGESVSLKIKSDPKDGDLITRQILKDY